MKKSTRYALLAAALALIFTACASAPEPEPELEQVPPQPAEDRVQAQREEAELLRQKIVEADLSQYAPADFEQGEEQLALGDEAGELEADEALDHYRNATESYRRVIDRAFEDVVDVARSDAQDAQRQADEVRARRGAPEPYEQAENMLSNAESERDQRNFTPSLEGYRGARESFEQAYEVAAERRDRAREAMDAADRAITQTEGTAEELEDELEDEEDELEEEE